MRGWERVLAGLGAAAGLAAMLLLPALPLDPGSAPPATGESAATPTPLVQRLAPAADGMDKTDGGADDKTPAPTGGDAGADAAPGETAVGYRAVWVSYLEWQEMDFSTAETFTADLAPRLDAIAGLGANVVLAQVRPFGDAFYPSALFPFSHLCTGAQGGDPGFDPLEILIEEAAARGLAVEGWINPYRLQAGGVPAALAEGNLANTHPDWVREAGEGLYLDPANPDVQQYIADGITELCENYSLAGIHFDDYFYPTADPAFDAADYAASGSALPLADWRRANVDALVRRCWAAAHAGGVRFGIAPQGDLSNNYNAQYSDVARWLAEPGYVDYLMPQLYWGLDYAAGGDTAHALGELSAEWLALPRADGVALYFGLGAYRIGEGDGGDRTGPGTEWQSGGALANQAAYLRGQGVTGLAVYRYDSLFNNALWPTLAAQEAAALRQAWG